MGGDQNLETPKAGTGEWANRAQGLGMDLDSLLVCSRVQGTHGCKSVCEPSGRGSCSVLTICRGGMGLGGAGHVYVSTAGVSVGARAGTALCDHLLPTWDSVWPQGDEADHWTFRLGPLYVRWGMRAIKSGGGGGGGSGKVQSLQTQLDWRPKRGTDNRSSHPGLQGEPFL